LTATFICPGQHEIHNKRYKFLIDKSKPYVYLSIDHIGPRKPLSVVEPNVGIYLRLYNNCSLPIVVRTFSLYSGNSTDEIGVMDNVVMNPTDLLEFYGNLPPMSALYPPIILGVPTKSSADRQPETKKTMPYGYNVQEWGSYITIPPGGNIYFSLPIDHVSDKWHVEIPFTFNLNVKSYIRAPVNVISLFMDDLK